MDKTKIDLKWCEHPKPYDMFDGCTKLIKSSEQISKTECISCGYFKKPYVISPIILNELEKGVWVVNYKDYNIRVEKYINSYSVTIVKGDEMVGIKCTDMDDCMLSIHYRIYMYEHSDKFTKSGM